VNVVVLQGKLSREPVERTAGVRAELANYEVTTRPEEGRSVTVPVAWFDPGREASSLDIGDEVVVVGHVARRFFATGGATQRPDGGSWPRWSCAPLNGARSSGPSPRALSEVADLVPELALDCTG